MSTDSAQAVAGPGRALQHYLLTATVARSGTEAAGPALLVSAIAVLGNASHASYLVACLTASAAVAGPVIGALVDRSHQPRRAFRLAMAMMALGLGLLALFLAHLPFWSLVVLAVAAGMGYPAITGAWSAQVPAMVDESHLRLAYSRDAATYSIAAVVAPPIATALVAVAATAPLWLPAALLVAGIVLIRWVPLHHRDQATGAMGGTAAGLLGNLKSGLSAMARIPALRRTILITTIGFAGTAAVFIAAPLLSKKFTGGLAFTSVILAGFAIGGLLSALAVAKFHVRRPDRDIVLFTLLSGLALALVGLAPTAWLVVVAAFLMGATEPVIVSGMFQVRARESSGSVRAQVFTTAASLRMTAFALASAACGALAGLGIGPVIALGVILHVAGVVVGVAFGPRSRASVRP